MLENFHIFIDDYTYELKNEANLNHIVKYFKNNNFKINNLEDFINLIKITIIISTVQSNSSDLKEIFNEEDLNLILSYGLPKNEWKISTQITTYINENLIEILETEDSVLIERTLDLICKYSTSKDNFEYIVNNFMSKNQVYFFKHQNFYKALGKNSKNLKGVFIENLFLPISIYHLKYQLDILDNYKNTYPEIRKKFENSLLELLQSNSFKNENIFLKKQIINIIFKSNIDSDIKINLDSLYKSIDLDLNEEVKKNGISTKENIDIYYYIDLISDMENIRDKMFFVDYFFEENKLFSIYSYISTIEDSTFSRLFTNLSNNTTHSNMFVNLMNRFVIDKYLKINFLIYEYKDLFWDELENLYNDVLKILNINEHRNFVKTLKALSSIELYEECCSKTVREIEYLLRCMYINKEFKVPISGSKHVFIGLNDILSKNPFSNLFSDEDIKCLKYILIEDTGFNYRNAISHNNIDSLNICDSLYLLSVFIFLLVSVDYLEF